MYIQNLHAADRRRAVVPAFVLSVLWVVAWARLFEMLDVTSSTVRLFLPNFIAGLLFATIFWELHFRQVPSYRKRSLWIPLVIGSIAFGTYFTVTSYLQD